MKYFNKGIKKVDMLVNSKILEQKIDQYYNKIISKHDLGLWSMEKYKDYLNPTFGIRLCSMGKPCVLKKIKSPKDSF